MMLFILSNRRANLENADMTPTGKSCYEKDYNYMGQFVALNKI
jgi:hypothetical protein